MQRPLASIVCILIGLNPLTAALKKVMLLPIINIEKDRNFAYLEASITDSLKDRLRVKFSFSELQEEKWTRIAEENFILRDDFHTKTAAMNLGILTNQDVVIHGGFKPANKKTAGGQVKSIIHATVHLLEVKKKTTIATIELDLPADSELFTSVNQVADRMEQEARKVIPSKEDATRVGLQAESEPLFAAWSLGVRGGGGIYVAGYAKYFDAQLPSMGLNLNAAMPKFGALRADFGFLFLSHKLKEGNDSAIQSMGVAGVASNYMLSLSFGYRIGLASKFYLEPQIGGGFVLQTTTITGSGINSTLNNGFPFVRGGLTTAFRVNQTIDASLTLETRAYLEQSVITYVSLALIGLNYKF